ncbi:carbamate kinase [Egibacter rhizosphaerae]|uniref:Carbamate kinase n=1 Tax=Egibacter rhizosphaerae TaxID=1670831 RepID=A0A411YD43_9ACTN|nr:carbamate kinase [Egibacter rhizosphaerae]QBI19096.1 carbamate kinase [Egibacter rhizosphaerae]
MSGARVVIALGGNAIAPAGSGGTADEQTRNITAAMRLVADLVETGHEIVLTHGNGPQVGNLLLKNDLAKDVVPPMPLDWCVAQTQATIGFTMCTALEAELAARGRPVPVIPLVSRVRVDRDDPAFASPTKPVGRYLTDPEEVERQVQATGEHWARQGEKGWRRVVASPEPREPLDGQSLALVLEGGAIPIANGGGGVPMVRSEDGSLHGVEAVIDKDLAAVPLAHAVGAQRLLILTDVPGVATGFGTPEERWLDSVTAGELRGLQADGHFAAGSMAPKVEACARFVEGSTVVEPWAAIGDLDDITDVAAGSSGTQVERG